MSQEKVPVLDLARMAEFADDMKPLPAIDSIFLGDYISRLLLTDYIKPPSSFGKVGNYECKTVTHEHITSIWMVLSEG